jgi:histidinol-phosphate/aromatic aminotransferase/cobyric acid decarboxylase-like protein
MGKVEQKFEIGYVIAKNIEYDGEYGPEIDLGLGTSPIGPAPELREPLARRDPLLELSKYPDPLHTRTRINIIKSLQLEGYGPENLVLNGNGSYGAGDEAIRHLSARGRKKIIVPPYSFPNVAQWAIRHSMQYTPVNSEDLDPVSTLQAIMKTDPEDLKYAVVYIDYPNNPTGYANPTLLREVVDYTSASGAVTILDAAFAEVLGDECGESIQHVLDKGGMALGSLSKTQGCPYVRSGYLIMGNEHIINGYSNEERMVFGLSGEAEFIYDKLFEPHNGKTLARMHADRVANYNEGTNRIIYPELEKLGLSVLPTDYRTPIQVVVSNKTDFYQRLRRVGVLTESLNDYRGTLNGNVGYDHSAVRLLTPGPNYIEPLLDRIKIATD